MPVTAQCLMLFINRILMIVPLILVLTLSVSLQAASQSPFKSCHACHGENLEGNIEINAPGLTGQLPDYLTRQLQNFKSGIRGSTDGDESGARMQAMKIMFTTDNLIAKAVKYIQTFEPKKPTKQIDADIESGRILYQRVCWMCHGFNAKGNPGLSVPSLVGIGDQYLVNQFQKFQLEQRGYKGSSDFARQMHLVSLVFPEPDQIKSIAAYIQTLPVN